MVVNKKAFVQIIDNAVTADCNITNRRQKKWINAGTDLILLCKTNAHTKITCGVLWLKSTIA